MYKLLIVDDEQYIADSLFAYFNQECGERYEVMKAYSAEEALEIARARRIDVLLSDICIPRVDGLALARQVTQLWPECETVFLTGHREFDYAYKALRQGSAAYVLKSEGYNHIREMVMNCFDRKDAKVLHDDRLVALKRRSEEADRVMQAELLMDLVKGGTQGVTAQELELVFSDMCADRPVCLMISRMRAEPNRLRRMLGTFTLNMLLTQEMPDLRVRHMASFNGAWGVHVFQTAHDGEDVNYADGRTMIRENLTYIQDILEKGYGFCFGFALLTEDVMWSELPVQYRHLHIALDEIPDDPVIIEKKPLLNTEKPLLSIADAKQLERFLNARDYRGMANFLRTCRGMFRRGVDFFTPPERLFYLHSLSLMAQHMSEHGTHQEALRRLIEMTAPESHFLDWEAAIDALTCVADEMSFDAEQRSHSRNAWVVNEIRKYIDEHFSQDVSLSVLSDHLHFNTSYLSYLFKNVTGGNVQSYIAEVRMRHAVDLLTDPTMRVKDVALACGYMSSKYFITTFKTAHGMTPQEWRNAHLPD